MNLEPWPAFDDIEIQAVVDILKSGKVNYWTGNQGKAFEKEFAEYSGARYGVALANGSVALDTALKILGIGPGDEVIVPARSFFASAGAVALTGATPVFADIDRCSQNLTTETISNLVSPKTKAIICVHLNGWPCDMEAILSLAKEHDLFVIEDCAQAHGAKINGRSVGSWGDIGVFSFCQDKIMSTGGEGGMLVTNDKGLWEKAWSFKDHGKSYAKVFSNDHPEGFRWLHESFGTNYRLTEFQAAMGRQQLLKLDDWVNRRRQLAEFLDKSFQQFECLRTETPPGNIYHSCYKHYVFVRPELLAEGWNRDRILREFTAQGIPGLSGSCPEIYLEKAFDVIEARPQIRLPVAQELGETSIQFLVHPTITDEQIEQVALIAADIFSKAQG
jgi:dTDP-4-amino-4,6-dideoxygalactose transaminase